jgi:hypothetical protein
MLTKASTKLINEGLIDIIENIQGALQIIKQQPKRITKDTNGKS